MTLVNLQPLCDFRGSFLGGPGNALIVVAALIKAIVVIGSVLGVVPFVVLLERKLVGYIQDRPGPNRAGPWGILQGILDGVKLLMKEDFIPRGADRTLYIIAPALFTIPSFLALCIIPFGPILEGQALLDFYTLFGLQGLWAPGSQLPLAVTNPNIGILYVFAISSVGVYGVTLAGWSSENKWSLLGGIRASAQMISYEISLSLSIIGVLLIAGSLNFYEIIDGQGVLASGESAGFLRFWEWNVFAQPVAFLLFITAMFAETNRLPFDLAEGESELTGGFHTEYSSMKFALFFMAEYMNMITVSAVCASLFLGGYQLIPESWITAVVGGGLGFLGNSEAGLPYPATLPQTVAAFIAPVGLALKVFLFLVLFIMVRGAWPRMRYDQVMNFGWKVMLIVGLINLVITAVGIGILTAIGAASVPAGAPAETVQQAISSTVDSYKWTIGLVTFAGLVAADRFYRARRRSALKAKYRNYLRPVGAARQSTSLAG